MGKKLSKAAMEKLDALKNEAAKDTTPVFTAPVKEDKPMMPTITIENVYLPHRPVVYYNAEGRLVKMTTPHVNEDGSKVWDEVVCNDFQLIVKTNTGDMHVIQLTNDLIEGTDGLWNPLRSFVYRAMSQYNRGALGTDDDYSAEEAKEDLKAIMHKPINVKVTTKTKTSKVGKEYTKTYFSPIYSKRDRLAETSDL